MLKLSEKPAGPRKIVLREAVPPVSAVKKGRKVVVPGSDGEPEAYIVMAPITASMRRRARKIMARQLPEDVEIANLDPDELVDLSETMTCELVRMGAVEWSGIGDATNTPIALTPDRETRIRTATDPDRPTGTIDLLLADDLLMQKIDAGYVRGDALREAEKNGLPASPSGTGEAGMPGNDTASSPAGGRRRATASRTTAARNARTRKTRSAPKRAKKPGRS